MSQIIVFCLVIYFKTKNKQSFNLSSRIINNMFAHQQYGFVSSPVAVVLLFANINIKY